MVDATPDWPSGSCDLGGGDTLFVTSIVVVAVVGIFFAIGRRHFERHPTYPKPQELADDERSNPK